jgi:hypothetical protein
VPFFVACRTPFRNNHLPYTQTFTPRSLTLAPGTPALLAAANPSRRLLMLSVSGTAPATFKFGSAPANALDGVTLGAASVSGEKGGSLLLSQGDAPVDAIWAYSTNGTSVNVHEGSVSAFL